MSDFPELKNDNILKAAFQKPHSKTPVWIMRQAGRYLPEFRKVREQHDFFKICQTPELACEVTLQPIDRFAGLFDASIIFSDILVIPQALGMTVEMLPKKGPHFPKPICTVDDVYEIVRRPNDASTLKYVYEAITLTRKKLDGRVPLFGFAGAPWTIMAYMIEGGGSKTLSLAKKFLYCQEEESHLLLKKITEMTILYLKEQIRAGAQMIQVFESWAGELGPDDFRTFCLPYLKHIQESIAQEFPNIPLTVFCRGAHYALEWLILETNYQVIGIDWTMDIYQVKSRIHQCLKKKQRPVTVQGNLDPCLLFGPGSLVKQRTKEMIEKWLLEADGSRTNYLSYICNLGHGILPETPVENVEIFLQTVKEVSQQILSK